MRDKEVFFDRIIAGSLKGRKIVLPKNAEVRPSKNRVRQAAFNLLTARVEWQGAVVVDLFCGSGAWGLEAASRGAKQVWCVDMDERCAAENVKVLGVGNVQAVAGDVRGWTPPALPDVVMLDPPYGKGLAQAVVARAKVIGKAGSWWCVETGSGEELAWDGFEEAEYRDYGGSRVWVARQASKELA